MKKAAKKKKEEKKKAKKKKKKEKEKEAKKEKKKKKKERRKKSSGEGGDDGDDGDSNGDASDAGSPDLGVLSDPGDVANWADDTEEGLMPKELAEARAAEPAKKRGAAPKSPSKRAVPAGPTKAVGFKLGRRRKVAPRKRLLKMGGLMSKMGLVSNLLGGDGDAMGGGDGDDGGNGGDGDSDASKRPKRPKRKAKAPFSLQWTLTHIFRIYEQREGLLRANILSRLKKEVARDEKVISVGSRKKQPAGSAWQMLKLKSLSAAGFTSMRESTLQSRAPKAKEKPLDVGAPTPFDSSDDDDAPQEDDTVADIVRSARVGPPTPGREDADGAQNNQWGEMDNFLLDHFQRQYGLDALAKKHVKLLVKCLGAYRNNEHVRQFARFLTKQWGFDDLKFFLVVIALARDGIPKEVTNMKQPERRSKEEADKFLSALSAPKGTPRAKSPPGRPVGTPNSGRPTTAGSAMSFSAFLAQDAIPKAAEPDWAPDGAPGPDGNPRGPVPPSLWESPHAATKQSANVKLKAMRAFAGKGGLAGAFGSGKAASAATPTAAGGAGGGSDSKEALTVDVGADVDVDVDADADADAKSKGGAKADGGLSPVSLARKQSAQFLDLMSASSRRGKARGLAAIAETDDAPPPPPSAILEWSRWPEHRLDILLQLQPPLQERRKGYLRATRGDVAYPEVTDGSPNWVSLGRAKRIAKLLLLPGQCDALLPRLEEESTTGMDDQWKRIKLPTHVLTTISTAPRLDRERFAELMVIARREARAQFESNLLRLFDSFDHDKSGVIEDAEFLNAVRVAFPYSLTKAQALAVFTRAMEKAKQQRALDGGEAAPLGARDGLTPTAFVKLLTVVSTMLDREVTA